jgi:hypothetical protein
MPVQDSYINSTAVQDFRRARRQAALNDIVGRLTGKSIGLLSYEEVRDKLRAREAAKRGLVWADTAISRATSCPGKTRSRIDGCE